jgi:hypothetical protein
MKKERGKSERKGVISGHKKAPLFKGGFLVSSVSSILFL